MKFQMNFSIQVNGSIQVDVSQSTELTLTSGEATSSKIPIIVLLGAPRVESMPRASRGMVEDG